MLDVSDIFRLGVFWYHFVVLYCSVSIDESKKFHWDFEKFISFNWMQVEIDSDFFAALFNKETAFIFLFNLVFFCDWFCNLVEIFFVKLLKFGSEYFSENLINFYEMAQFDHSIGFIENEIFQVLKVKYFILQELMNSTWSTDYNVGFSLANDSELFQFWHTTDNRDDWNIAADMFENLSDILLNLLSQLSGWSDN